MISRNTAATLGKMALADPEFLRAYQSSSHPLHAQAVAGMAALRYFEHDHPTYPNGRPVPFAYLPVERQADARAHLAAVAPAAPAIAQLEGAPFNADGALTAAEIAQATLTAHVAHEIADPAYAAIVADRNHPQHADAIAERSALYEAIHPEPDAEPPPPPVVEPDAAAIPPQHAPVVTGQGPDAARADLDRLRGDAAFQAVYRDGAHPGHADALARMSGLYRAAYPDLPESPATGPASPPAAA